MLDMTDSFEAEGVAVVTTSFASVLMASPTVGVTKSAWRFHNLTRQSVSCYILVDVQKQHEKIEDENRYEIS
jgi:deoxyinosine 3'endonuclease (endonuclease V)